MVLQLDIWLVVEEQGNSLNFNKREEAGLVGGIPIVKDPVVLEFLEPEGQAQIAVTLNMRVLGLEVLREGDG